MAVSALALPPADARLAVGQLRLALVGHEGQRDPLAVVRGGTVAVGRALLAHAVGRREIKDFVGTCTYFNGMCKSAVDSSIYMRLKWEMNSKLNLSENTRIFGAFKFVNGYETLCLTRHQLSVLSSETFFWKPSYSESGSQKN